MGKVLCISTEKCPTCNGTGFCRHERGITFSREKVSEGAFSVICGNSNESDGYCHRKFTIDTKITCSGCGAFAYRDVNQSHLGSCKRDYYFCCVSAELFGHTNSVNWYYRG